MTVRRDYLEEDFDDFYRREYRRVLALAYALCGSPWVAEELAQEGFLIVLRRMHSDAGMVNPEGFVRTTVANLCRSAVRRRYAETRALTRFVRRDVPLPPLPPPAEDF